MGRHRQETDRTWYTGIQVVVGFGFFKIRICSPTACGYLQAVGLVFVFLSLNKTFPCLSTSWQTWSQNGQVWALRFPMGLRPVRGWPNILKTWILIKNFTAVHSYIFVPCRSFGVFNKVHLWLFSSLYWRTTLFTFFVSFYFTTIGYMFHIFICLSNLVKIGHRDYVVCLWEKPRAADN